ncbi:hypothetical protein PIB30_026685 [Stylosanthes scabra]|uniref:Uncharacterized protein n=1 Tax=Stylosanthes scabra TaxID=79078 RepID=A0ABU6QAM6_9FABA|nr:hypothetical protein [Stylosanthes scabra]
MRELKALSPHYQDGQTSSRSKTRPPHHPRHHVLPSRSLAVPLAALPSPSPVIA